MKKLFLFILAACMLLPLSNTQAQISRGIVGNKGFDDRESVNEFFGSKDRRRMQARNKQLRESNERLERQIRQLERRLDDCMDGRRRRYSRKSPVSSHYSRNDRYGHNRRMERERHQLKQEHEYLRNKRAWLQDELEDCQKRNDRKYQNSYKRSDRYGKYGKAGKKDRHHPKCKGCDRCEDAVYKDRSYQKKPSYKSKHSHKKKSRKHY